MSTAITSIRMAWRKGIGQRANGILVLSALSSLLFTSIPLFAQRGGGPPAAPVNAAIGNPAAIAEGEKLYNETCTACHGKDGTGGELGPPVAAQNRRYLRRTDQEIFDTIKNGIVGTQMPPYGGQFSDDNIWKVTAYIRGLRGTAIDTPAQGDAAAGEATFWTGAKCGACHMVKGRGNVLGPDLSNLGGTRKVQNIVDALTKVNHKIVADGGTHDATIVANTSYQPVRITTADGKVVSGILKNEDSFSLQVLGKDDLNLYRFKRADVKVFYDPQSLMPHDWDKRLSPVEFQNLLAFLTRLYVPPPPAPPARGGGAPVG